MKIETCFIVIVFLSSLVLSFSLAFSLVGCSSQSSDFKGSDVRGDGNIRSTAKLGPEKVYPPEWEVGDYWVIKRIESIAGDVDIKYFVVLVENKTYLNVTVPLTAKEQDLNLKALYLRQPKTFDELVHSSVEGDNWIDEPVYVLGRYQPIKLMPVRDYVSDCDEPEYYRLDFSLDTLKKELVYSQHDLSLLWDSDNPGRMLKMFHWPLRAGKYWSFPIVNMDSEEGQEYVRQKIEEGLEQGYDFKQHQVYGRGVVTDYTDGVFTVELYGLYPFFANFDKKDQTFRYAAEQEFWEWNTHSDLAGVKLNFTETIGFSGHAANLTFDQDGNPLFFRNLTSLVDHRVENPNFEILCES